MNIAGRQISADHPPYIIAEMSANHNGSLDMAKYIIESAEASRADAVKLQLYDPAKLAEARGGADKVIEGGPWAGMTLGELYRQAHTPREWFPDLMDCAARSGITIFSSVFDEDGVDFVDGLGMPAFKISSFDLTNLALIRKAASTGKPLIISTGMGTMEDVGKAIMAAQGAGANLALLHCVSEYPCPAGKANLARIDELKRQIGIVGYSDHTAGFGAAAAAVSRGACIIEKHVTITHKSVDGLFSMGVDEFATFTNVIRDAWRANRPSDPDATYADMRVRAA